MSVKVAAAPWRGLVLPGAATLVALAVLIGLGVWQLERKAWKDDLVARIEARAFGAPSPLPSEAEWPSWSPEADEYRRVTVTGRFLHEHETLVHGLMSAQRGQPVQGYDVLTPLRLPDGSLVIVNRGFVPTELADPERRGEGQVAWETTVTGLVRAPQVRNPFLPPNDPATDRWFVRRPAEIAEAKGLRRVAPFLIDADATPVPGGWPRGGQTRLDFPNNHLQYAFTWFGLGLTLVGVFVAFARRRLKAASAEPL